MNKFKLQQIGLLLCGVCLSIFLMVSFLTVFVLPFLVSRIFQPMNNSKKINVRCITYLTFIFLQWYI